MNNRKLNNLINKWKARKNQWTKSSSKTINKQNIGEKNNKQAKLRNKNKNKLNQQANQNEQDTNLWSFLFLSFNMNCFSDQGINDWWHESNNDYIIKIF